MLIETLLYVSKYIQKPKTKQDHSNALCNISAKCIFIMIANQNILGRNTKSFRYHTLWRGNVVQYARNHDEIERAIVKGQLGTVAHLQIRFGQALPRPVDQARSHVDSVKAWRG